MASTGLPALRQPISKVICFTGKREQYAHRNMKTDLFSVSNIFTKRLLRIPDCQRGYALSEKQLTDYRADLVVGVFLFFIGGCMEIIENSIKKLKEADYFAILISSVCLHHRSLQADIPLKVNSKNGAVPPPLLVDEVSFLFSAFLNACYSVLSYLKEDTRTKHLFIEFKNKHSNFYGSKITGGYRTRAVHFHPVVPKDVGWKEYLMTAEEEKFWDSLEEAFGPAELSDCSGPLEWEKPKIYLEEYEPQKPIDQVCFDHYFEIMALIESAESVINTPT